MFGRRAADGDVETALAAAYPGAGPDVLAAVLASPERPKRSEVAGWVDEQVLREAARRCARESGLDQAAYPPDGDEALRVYLADEIADADVDAVGAAAWAQARAEAWDDHGDPLRDERELWWAEQLPAAAAQVDAWRAERA
ncbi:MAG: hypothetical protein U0R76_11745 [Candidatus Nanopelagicales bacterium]